MLKLRRTRRSLTGLVGLAALTLAGLSASGFAQANETAGPWYQVEVILFAHENSPDDEVARNDVTLNYPDHWVELKDPKAVAAQAPAAAPDDASAPTPPASDEAFALAAGSAPVHTAPAAADLDRDPFFRLPAHLRELSLQADALKRSNSHRLLFHEAWRQPVRASNSTPAIIVSSGKLYDDHRELEGSFSVSVSRYLHLNTNLWLTDFVRVDAAGEQRDYWPELPSRPAQKQVQLDASMLNQGSGVSDYGWDSNSSPWERALQLEDNYDFSAPSVSKAYTPAQISVLRQQRRMRSGEVHYLDHPHMGMVILIKPYEVPAGAGN